MSQVNVLVAVNVAAAIAKDNLNDYVFMVDTNDYIGTGNPSEGTNELVTHCTNGDTIVWTVVSIDPNLPISIHSFQGQAIPSLVNPAVYPQTGNKVWGGRVNSAANQSQYNMTLLLNNSQLMTFDPFITSVNQN